MGADSIPQEGEQVTHKERSSTLILKDDTEKLKILEAGWTTHANFKGNFGCISGYKYKDKPCKFPRGLATASSQAKDRWRKTPSERSRTATRTRT